MKNNRKTKNELIAELESIRKKVNDLEKQVADRKLAEQAGKRAEAALRDSEERYRTTMMSVGDGVITTDTGGRLELLNPVAEALTGWNQEEAHGKQLEKVFRIINEETRQIVENPVRRVMREGIVVGLANHSVLIAKNGTENPIADSGAPIRNEKGNIVGVVLVFRDQTQERTVQKALQESERKFRETIKYLDEGYYSCMMDGVVLEHNQAFNRILGFDIAKDLKGAKLPDFWQNPDERKVYLQELMARGSIMNYLINAKKFDGEKIVVMANAHLVKDENDKLVRIEGTFTDFTEHKRVEEALASSEQFLSNVIEQSPVSLWISDSEGTLIKMNQACRELFGITDEEAVGKYNLLKDNLIESQGFMALVEGVFENGAIARFTIDYDVRRVEHIEVKGATHRILDVVLSPIKDIHGKLANVLVQHKDITESKIAEEALRKSEKQYHVLFDEMLSGFAVHEIICDQSGTPTDYRFLSVNTAFEKMTGLDACSILGKTVLEVMPGIESSWIARYGKVALTGEPTQFDNYAAALGKYYEVHAYCPEHGKFATLINDITERKQVEEALRWSEERFSNAFQTSPYAITITHAEDGRFVEVNDAFTTIAGYTREETIADSSIGLKMWVNETERQRVVNDLRAGHAVVGREYRFRIKSGKEIMGLFSAQIIRLSEGTCILSSINDITERKRMEEELHSASLYARSLIEASIDPLVTIGQDGKITDVNNSSEQVTGRTRKELIGTDFSDYFTEPEKAQSGYKQVFQDGSVHDYPLSIRHTSGKITDVHYNATVYRNEAGEIQGVFAAARDITDRKRAEEKLLQQLNELRRWQELMLGREDRVRQLKHEVDELLSRLGEPIRYPSQEGVSEGQG